MPEHTQFDRKTSRRSPGCLKPEKSICISGSVGRSGTSHNRVFASARRSIRLTTLGSNWVPEQRRNSPRASCWPRSEGRYYRMLAPMNFEFADHMRYRLSAEPPALAACAGDTVSGKSGPAHFQVREIDFQRPTLIRLQESFDDGWVEVGPRALGDGLLGV